MTIKLLEENGEETWWEAFTRFVKEHPLLFTGILASAGLGAGVIIAKKGSE